jgi:hypothetical protein
VIAQVSYIVPVEVVVDTDTGTVQRVVVIDEGIQLDADDNVHGEGYTPLADAAARARAREIADTAEWPGWQHGW